MVVVVVICHGHYGSFRVLRVWRGMGEMGDQEEGRRRRGGREEG